MPLSQHLDVTVSIMSYNNAGFIGQTIESVLAQTGVSLEVIVFDDRSSDDSLAVLERYTTNPRFRFEVNSTNLGMMGNYNRCVDSGSGRYVVVLGSDDIMYPGHLSSLFAALELHPEAPLAYTQCNWIDELSTVLRYADHPGHLPHSYFGHRDEVVNLLIYDNYITPSAVMLRRSILDKVRLPDGHVHAPDMVAGDWELWTRIARTAPDFIFLHQATLGYRIHGGQVSHSFYDSDKPLAEHARILELNLVDPSACHRMQEAADRIWALYERRATGYAPDIQAKYEERSKAIKAVLFSPDVNASHKASSLNWPIDSLQNKSLIPMNNSDPTVSVIVPTHNRPDLLVRALRSIKNQGYANIEIVVVNDAGVDVENLVSWLGKDSNIVYVRHGLNRGLSAARNTGLSLARGEIIVYLDDDDVFLPDHVATIVDALQKRNAPFVYAEAEYVSESVEHGQMRELSRTRPYTNLDYSKERLHIHNYIPVNTWGHWKSILDRTGYFDECLDNHEDWDFLLRCSRQFDLMRIPKVTVQVHQRAQADNMLRRERHKFYDTYKLLYARYDDLGNPNIAQRRKQLLQQLLTQGESPLNAEIIGKSCTVHVPGRSGPSRIVVYSRDVRVTACPQVRFLRAFKDLDKAWNLTWAVKENADGHGSADLVPDADLYVISRTFPGGDTREVVEALFASGKPVIYETDDLLIDLPPDNLHAGEYSAHVPFIEDVMRRAAAVVVSTAGLARRLEAYNKSVRVLPNLVDYTLFNRVPPENGRQVNIGVVGTATRGRDFAIIDAALRRICQEYGKRIRVFFMGSMPESWVGHPNAQSIPFTADYGGYAARMKGLNLDIGLAPLEDHAFNACKSPIKWLEFSALGMAGVYSFVPAYRDVIEHGKTGLLVDNNTDKWVNAIKLLVDYPEFRLELALSAQLKVFKEHSLQKQSHLVREAYDAILASSLRAPAIDSAKALTEGDPNTCDIDYYGLWQVGHGYQESDLRWISERMTSWSHPPSIHVGVICRGGQEDRLANNLKSLSQQFHKGWLLSVVAEIAPPPGLDELPQITWIQAAPEVAYEQVNRALCARGDWVGLMEAGDRLPLHATFAVAHAVLNHPEWRMLYSDEDRLSEDGSRHTPFFKTDYDPDMLRAAPFTLGGLFLLDRGLFNELGGFRTEAEGVASWDLVLRASERLSADEVGHLADVLYHRHEAGGHCLREPEEVWQVAGECLRKHLSRLDWAADVEDGPLPGSFRIRHHILDNPLVSIIVPTKNKVDLLRNCLTSLIEGTGYSHCEVLVVDNGSDDPETLAYLQALRELGSNSLKVFSFPGLFNFSAMNNLAAREARGEYLLLLNNDTQVLHEDWLEEMLGYAQREDVGAVGARLLYPDGTIQHAGAILGLGGMGSNHVFSKAAGDDPGYYGRLMLPQAYSAVTAACLLTRKTHYEAVGGLDETTFQVNFNDVDYCLKLRERGLKVIWTPHATLCHEESVSQAAADVELLAREEKYKRLYREVEAVVAKWPRWFANDPAYNRNLSLIQPFQPEPTPALTWDPEWRPAPRVLSIHADTMGCGEYRIIAPMRALTRAGKAMGWDAAGYFHPREYARMDPESVVFQRQLEEGQIEFMQRIARITKAFRVYELDDLITNIPIMSSQKKLFVEQKDVNKRFRKAVSLCHRFVVSTEYLAEAFKGYCDDIVVVPNYLERARWDGYRPMRRGGAKARVGWAGSATHAGDLRLIVDVVKATADEVDWIFFGMCPDAIRPLVREFHEPVKLDDYAAKLASLDLDLAIAPLEDIPFNHGKSHLRLLEYGVMGYPVVCSDITPYRGSFPVARVAPKFKAWVEAIRERVADRDALAREGDALRDHVQRHWMLEDHLDVWLRAWLPPATGFSGRSR